ncbi:MAG: DUF4251 domain-containing protein [Prevotella sp.]|nr:DUF4251 domain-containing protein [Prevotella sp.]
MRKRIGQVLLLAMVVLLSACATQQQRAERRAATQQAVEKAVAERRLHIDVTSMNTLRYGSRMVTPDFFLELQGDTLNSYLPYLGQAYQAPMAQPAQGLNFRERILQLQESRPKPHLIHFDIDVKTKEDVYRYLVDVYDNGKAAIRVQSQHRDAISFDGDCDLPELINGK